MADVHLLPAPTKADNDKKEYRVIELPNGMRALLISDTSYPLDKLDEEEAAIEDDADEALDSSDEAIDDIFSGDDSEDDDEGDEAEGELGAPPKRPKAESGLKKSAAGLCVGMGSFSDPNDLPGLAHFLEHMVFMGSAKYPDENGFDDFAAKHGGTDNASTDCETTTFYFETQRKHFREGLDRFAQFFVAPLMARAAMQRERQAVDSEFGQALPSDYYRKQQIFGGLAKAGHPMRKFMWGNCASLSPASLTDEAIHARLHAFKDRHYTAQSMTMTVQAQETLDSLQAWVTESFEHVPNNGQSKETFAHLTSPFGTPEFHRLYKVAPVANVYQVDLSWSLPALSHEYRVKPLHYLSWIIGHEGRGSLISRLRKNVWALSLTAGNAGDGFEFNSTHSVFTVTIVLTAKGFENISSVLETVFGYIAMVKSAGPNERIYAEIQKIEELEFQFGDEAQPADNVETICENMQYYPSELYLTGDDLMFEYNAKLISACLDALSADSVNVVMMAREFKADCDHTEPWFKTKFKSEDIPSEWKGRWSSAVAPPGLHLPEPNAFIAEDLAVKPAEEADVGEFPRRIDQEAQSGGGGGELWYRKDTIFAQPRANVYFHLDASALVMASVRNAVCLDLLVSCVAQQMVEDTYPADIAQISQTFCSGDRGIVMKLNGLSDKLPLALQTMLKHLVDFEANVDAEMFEAVRAESKRAFYNHFIKPSRLVRDVRLGVLQDVFVSAHDKHRVVDGVGLDEVKAFRAALLDAVTVQAIVQGNVTSAEALRLFDDVSAQLKRGRSAAAAADIRETRCNALPAGVKCLRLNGFNPRDTNTMVTNYYQLGPGDLRQYAVLELGCLLMEEPAFDRLRTQEQLGYAVSSVLRDTFGVLGVSVTINSQATKFSAAHVDERIEAFMRWFVEEKLERLTQDEFQTALTTLIKMKKQRDVTLEEETSRNWNEIVARDYLFDRHVREIALLEDPGVASVAAVKDLFARLVRLSPRKLSVQVVGSSAAAAADGDEDDGGADGDEDDDADTGIDDEGDESLADDDADPDGEFSMSFVAPDDAAAAADFVVDAQAFKAALKTYPVVHITQ